MEFIQCLHCQKQYAVNDKLRAAVGKKIRCKHCSDVFEIIIQNSSEPKASDSTQSTPQQASPTKVEKDTFVNQSQEQDESEENKQAATAPLFEEDAFISHAQEPHKPATDKQPVATQKQVEEDKLSTPSKHDTSEESKSIKNMQEQEPVSENPPVDEQKIDETVQETKPTKKKINVQLLITVSLTILLVIAAISAYLFLSKTSAPKKDVQSIMPKEMFKPIEIKMPDVKPEMISKDVYKTAPVVSEEVEEVQAAITPPEQIKKPTPKAKFTPSQVCKNAAAEYWLRTHQLATESLDTAVYMKLLNQNLEQAEEIRTHCKEKSLVGLISKAARTDIKPAWFINELESRITFQQAKPKKSSGSNQFGR